MRYPALLIALALASGCTKDREGSVIPGPPTDTRLVDAGNPTAQPPDGGTLEGSKVTDPNAVASSKTAGLVIEGLAGPETVIYDDQADVYLVSNINGKPMEKDDDGFISRLSPSGEMLELKWIDGSKPEVALDSPMGMVLDRDTLYVADADAVRLFDRRTGIAKGSWKVPNPHFPNDVTLDDQGRVILTETGIKVEPHDILKVGDYAIYRFDKKGKAETLAKGDALQGPNGVKWTKDGILFVTFMGMAVEKLQGKKPVEVAKLPASQCDGFVLLPDDTMLTGCWSSAAVYYVDRDRHAREVAGNLLTPAGLHYDLKRKVILVPLVTENQVRIIPFDYTKQAPPTEAKP